LEVFIFCYTYQAKDKEQRINKKDRGTKWLLYANFILCVGISFCFASQKMAMGIRDIKFPDFFSYIGVLLIFIGIVVRLTAVLTLKRAFTLNVQTANTQHLIKTGLYHIVRHPAYAGSIMSLLGVPIALKNVIATLIVLLSCIACYWIRIHVEEIALKEYFGNEFKEYALSTYKVIPYIW